MKQLIFLGLWMVCVGVAQETATPPAPQPTPATAEAGQTPEPKKEEPAPKQEVVSSKPSVPALKLKPIPNSPIKIAKIHEVRTDGTVKSGGNEALEFEQKYWMHGAVTEAEKEAKRGHYFVISWENKSAPIDVEVRFEYRQVGSKEQVRVLKLNYPQIKGTERSIFNVVGRAYKEYGAIQSWRLTFWRGDQLLAARESFIW